MATHKNSDGEFLHETPGRARACAARVGCPNTETSAELDERWGRYVGVVLLRPDQGWMAGQVRERGCRVGVAETQARHVTQPEAEERWP